MIRSNPGLYVHFPFCRGKCDYCSFYSLNNQNYEQIAEYLKALKEELKNKSETYSEKTFDTIYIGGGTPSIITTTDVSSFILSIRKYYNIAENCEITIECNPSDISFEKLKEYYDIGINRLSIGIQSLDENCRNFLGRKGTFEQKELLKTIQESPIKNISLDYMAGVRGQSVELVKKELNELIDTNPKHFSLYILSIDENTPLHSRFKVNEKYEDFQSEIYLLASQILKENGFEHYEISNFAIPGFESKHNLKYWSFDEYLGFGPGAHSYINKERFSNEADVNKYVKNDFKVIHDKRNENEIEKEFILTSFRILKGFSVDDYVNIFKRELNSDLIKNLNREVEKGNIKKFKKNGSDHYKINEKRILFFDSIIYDICDY